MDKVRQQSMFWFGLPDHCLVFTWQMFSIFVQKKIKASQYPLNSIIVFHVQIILK